MSLTRLSSFWLSVSLASFVASLPVPARAQANYPNRPVRIVVPFTAGGGVDTIARAVGQKLAEKLGQPFVVDNRPGGSTVVGTLAVARAAPDGYTLLMASSSFTTAPALSKVVPFDPARDFVPVAMVANAPAVVAVTANSSALTINDLIRQAKAQPGKLTAANYGSGSTPHLVAELFQQTTGTKFLNVPYNGGNPAVLSTVTAQTDMIFASALPVLSQVNSGRLRILAVGSRNRLAMLPEVPTFVEQNVSLQTGTWFGLVAPAGTPAAVVARINLAVKTMESDIAFQKSLQEQGAEFITLTTAEFSEFLKNDQSRWNKVISTAHIHPE